MLKGKIEYNGFLKIIRKNKKEINSFCSFVGEECRCGHYCPHFDDSEATDAVGSYILKLTCGRITGVDILIIQDDRK